MILSVRPMCLLVLPLKLVGEGFEEHTGNIIWGFKTIVLVYHNYR